MNLTCKHQKISKIINIEQKPDFQKRAKRMGGPKKINNFMQKAWFFVEKICKKRGQKNGDSAAEVPKKSTLEMRKKGQKPTKTHTCI